MAYASTSKDYSILSSKETKEPLFGSKDNDGGKDQLNFYESLYNFKKMFPKLDYEVIETVLRSNSGKVDKTIDQLLSMSQDNEITEAIINFATTNSGAETQKTQNPSSNLTCLDESSNDQPPSYSQLVSLNLIGKDEAAKTLTFTANSSLSSATEKEDSGTLKASSLDSSSYKISKKYINNFNEILVGDLAKDFLRIKLNNEQVKKLKSSIKKARRNEIVALLNNKTPENPEYSFELKRQLEALGQRSSSKETNNNEDSSESEHEMILEDWQYRHSKLMSTFEKRRTQLIQDEYLASVIQNEEFLNEIRSNQDFMRTLKAETVSEQSRIRNQLEISNTELKAALRAGMKMGQLTRAKLTRLATKYTSKVRQKRCSGRGERFGDVYLEDELRGGSNHILRRENELPANDSAERKISSTYSLERIRDEELNSVNSGGSNEMTSGNRAKKVYKSFKTAIKRNAMAKPTQQQQSLLDEDEDQFNGFCYDQNGKFDLARNRFSKTNLNENLLINRSTNLERMPNLITFKSDYSYEDNNKK